MSDAANQVARGPEYICPDCGAERADVENLDGGYLAECPNCHSTVTPFREAPAPRVLPPPTHEPWDSDPGFLGMCSFATFDWACRLAPNHKGPHRG